MLKRASNNPVKRFLDIFRKPRVVTRTASASGVTQPVGTRGMTSFGVDADTGTPATIADGQTLSIIGGTDVSTTMSGKTVVVDFTGAVTGMASFDLDSDSGTAETVTDGETVNILGGVGIDGVVSATNTVTLSINGNVRYVTIQTGDYNILDTDHVLLFTGSSESTFTLPLASANYAREYMIRNAGTAKLLIVPSGSNWLDGGTLNSLDINEAATFICVSDAGDGFWNTFL